MRKLLIVFFIFYGVSMFSQARLNISTGSSVYFHFNSFQKYSNGVTYNDFTKLTVFYKDTANPIVYPDWRIDVKALSSDIIGENPANTLNLNFIELEAAGVGTSGLQVLSASDISLYSALGTTDPGTASVFITYYCGVTNSLIGKNPDYYVVDLLFTLMGE